MTASSTESAGMSDEERFSTLMIARVAPDGRWVNVPPELCRLLGYGEAELLARTVKEVTHPEDFAALWKQCERLLHGEIKSFELEKRCLGKDGAIIWMTMNCSLVNDAQGRPDHFLAYVRDVTNRRRNEEALSRTEAVYRRAITAANAVPYSIDYRTESFSFMGEGILGMTGFSAHEMTPQLWRSITSECIVRGEAAGLTMEEAIHRTRAGEFRSWQSDSLIVTREGKKRWITDTSVEMLDEHSRPIGSIGIFQDITDRKKAEQVLQESEEKFRAAFTGAAIGMALVGMDGRFLKVNPALCGMLGYTEPELLATTFQALTHAEDLHASVQRLREIPNDKPFSLEFEKRYIHKQGRSVWVQINSSLVRDLQRAPLYFVTQIQDITGRKLSATQLEQSLSLLRATLESTADGILVVDKEGKIMSFNQKFVEMWRIPIPFLESNDHRRVAVYAMEQLKEPDQFILKVKQLHADPDAESFDALEFKDGRVFERFSKPQRVGRNIAGRVWSFRDVTERRVAERELREKEASLLEAQRVGQVGSWRADLVSGKLDWSEETYRIFGRRSGEFVPTNADFFRAVHPEDRERVRTTSIESLREGKSYGIDHRIILPNGAERVVHEQAEIIGNAAGQPIQMIGTVQDITERVSLEVQLRQSQKMESVGQLAAGVAHDFNNILTVIQGHVDLVMANESLGPDTQDSLREISLAAGRAANLTRQLLTFSRKQITQPRMLDLNDVVANLSKMLQRVIGEHIVLDFQPVAALPAVRADASMMEQIVTNLAVNARDAMPDGGRLTIRLAAVETDHDYARQHAEARPGRFVSLTVGDTGSGISPEIMPRIFDPFFTTKEVGKGTGLGLATVYGIVKQHRGWIEVTSHAGQGTEFKLFLPANVEPTASQGSAQLAEDSGKGAGTILLVEDEPSLRDLARRVLEHRGYRVLTAGSGAEAIKVWENAGTEVDLLLTDMVMPEGISGKELARRLLERKPELRIIYTSGYSLELMGEDSTVKNGIAFLPKPYQPRELAGFVGQVLGSKSKNGPKT